MHNNEPRKAFEEWLNNWWAEKCADENMRNGDTRESDGQIIAYVINDNGESLDISSESHVLYYERYHGDYAEHNTHWGL